MSVLERLQSGRTGKPQTPRVPYARPAGSVILPLAGGGKRPLLTGWNMPDYVPDPVGPGDNVGQRLDGLTVIDCDEPGAIEWWEANGVPTPFVCESRPGRRSYWYGGEALPPQYVHWTMPDGERGGEVRVGHMAQCVIPPSVHPDAGTTYRWLGPEPGDWSTLPPISRDQLPPIPGRIKSEGPGGEWDGPGAAVVSWFRDGWCPAGDHHSPGLSLGEMPDGTYLPHCFGGCDRDAVIGALVDSGRYSRDELYPPAPPELVAEVPALRLVTAYELSTKDFPPVRWIVKDRIPEGVTLLAGKPKVGKSWLSLDLGDAVASGGTFLGRGVRQGAVLYLALEDNERRLKERLERLDGVSRHLHITTVAPRMPDLMPALEAWVSQVERPRLIVVDVLGRVRPPARDGQDQYDAAYDVIGPMQRFAAEHRLGVVLVHHTRKSGVERGGDELDAVSGSMGLAGAADTGLVLGRDSLYGRGRDVSEYRVPLVFLEDSCRWAEAPDVIAELEGGGTVKISGTMRLFADAVQKAGVPIKLADLTVPPSVTYSTWKRAARDAIAAGLVDNPGHGVYAARVLPENVVPISPSAQ